MKLTKLFLCSVLCGNIALAAAQNTGIYTGLNFGLNIINAKQTVTVIPYYRETSTVTHNNYHGDGVTGGIALGYLYNFTHYFLAAEFDAFAASGSITSSNSNWEGTGMNISTKEKQDTALQFSVLPGINISDNASIYAKVGLVQGQFKVSTGADGAGDLGYSGDRSKWISGYVVGFGANEKLNKKLNLRLEYDFIDYRKQSFSNQLPLDLGGSTINTSIHPENQLVLLSLIYSFGAPA